MKTALVFVPGSRHSCKDQLERANGVFASHEWRHEVVELEGRRLPASELRQTIAFWGAAGCIDFCGEHAYPLPMEAYPAVAGTVSVYRDAHFIRELPNEDMELLLFSKKRSLVLAGWPHRPGSAVKPRPVKIRAEVTDDVIHFSTTEAPHAGDVMALVFMVGGRRHFTWVKSADGHAYARTFSLAELGYAKGKRILFNTQVWDNDDGVVAEGYIGLSTDLNGEKTSEWAELEF